MEVCPEQALSADSKGKAIVDRQRCTVCRDCGPTCDPKALEIVGRTVNADEVLEVVLRDKAYYKSSGGGMTLSGGEPLMQPGFAKALLQEAKDHGLHCCVETSGYALWGSIRGMVPLVDQWLFDVKETDRRLHQKFIGKPNEMILSNLKRLHDTGAKILVRCPMIPQHNARTGHLDGLVRLARDLPRLDGIELLPYYDLWRSKLDRFALKSSLPASVRPPSRETLDRWKDYLRKRGVTVVG
jgi:pyruvate formate lyase activating enzyme